MSLKDDYVIFGVYEDLCVARKFTYEGLVIGILLPFGNGESVTLSRQEVKELIEHLNNVLNESE